MSSVDPTQVPELITNEGYPALFESYEAEPTVYDQVCRVITDLDNIQTPYYGDKGTTVQGVEGHKRREDGQPVEKSSMNTAFTWRVAIPVYSRSIVIPSRMLKANDANQRVAARIREAAEGWGELARIEKEDFVAGIFQKGTLTAGSDVYFDNSWPGEADPNLGFIYDGLPFFDTAHTISGGSTTYANHVVSRSLSATNLQSQYILMADTNAKDERGNRISIRPDTLMVPSALKFDAEAIINSIQQPGTANNDTNTAQGLVRVVENRALTDDANAWWLGQAGRGVRCYDSGAPMMREVIHPNGDVEIISEYHFGAGVDNWRYWSCANKSA